MPMSISPNATQMRAAVAYTRERRMSRRTRLSRARLSSTARRMDSHTSRDVATAMLTGNAFQWSAFRRDGLCYRLPCAVRIIGEKAPAAMIRNARPAHNQMVGI